MQILTRKEIEEIVDQDGFDSLKVKFYIEGDDKNYKGEIVIGKMYDGDNRNTIFLLNDGAKQGNTPMDMRGWNSGWVLSTYSDYSDLVFYTGKRDKISNEEIVNGFVEISESGKKIIKNADDDETIKGYHTKIPLIFHRREKEPLKRTDFFGIEIEYNWIRTNNGVVNWMKNNQGFFHYERDGSLDYGIESISQPFSELYYHSVGKHKIEELVKQIPARSSGDLTVVNGTGLHIHISRASLTDEMVCKLYFFLNNNEWRNQIKLIAGRSSERWAQPIDDCKKNKSKDCKDSNKDNAREGARYVSLNLENENTVEIRIFKSSYIVWKILGRIEFTMCLINYLRLTEGRYWNGVSFDKFVEFAVDRASEYPNLFTLLNDTKIVGNDGEVSEGDFEPTIPPPDMVVGEEELPF